MRTLHLYNEMKTTTLTAKYRKRVFFVDITTNKQHIEAWLYTDDMGIKELMFGMDNAETEDFVNLVYSHFERYADSYIKSYYEEV